MPKSEPFQQVERALLRASVAQDDENEFVLPVSDGLDAFATPWQTGYVAGAHVRFSIVSEGVVRQTPYRICGTAHGMFLAHTALTLPDEDMKRFAAQVGKGDFAVADASERSAGPRLRRRFRCAGRCMHA